MMQDWYKAKKLSQKLELISKLMASATAFCIPLSTTLTDIFFILTPVFYFLAGNWQQKLRETFSKPLAWIFMFFFALFIAGASYTTAPLSDALRILSKYSKFFWAIFFIPIFTEQRIRHLSLNTFIIAITIMLVASFLQAAGFIHLQIANGGPVEVFKGHIAFSFLLAFTAYLLMLKLEQLIRELVTLRCAASSSLECKYLSSRDCKYSSSRDCKYLLSRDCKYSSSRGLTAGSRSAGSQKLLKMFFLLLLFALIIYNLFFLTMGRAGYFIFAVLTILFCIQKLSAKRIIIVLIIVFISLVFGSALLFNFSPMFKNRVSAIVTEVQSYREKKEHVETSIGMRLMFWKKSLRIINSHPLFGTGTGSFAHEYANLTPTPNLLIRNPHNEYINITIQLGLLGLTYLLCMFGMELYYSSFLAENYRQIAQAVVIAIIIGSLANSWLMDTTEGHLYAFFMALTFGSYYHDYSQYRNSRKI